MELQFHDFIKAYDELHSAKYPLLPTAGYAYLVGVLTYCIEQGFTVDEVQERLDTITNENVAELQYFLAVADA